MKKVLKNIGSFFSDIFDKLWIWQRGVGFRKHYKGGADWAKNIKDVLSDDEKHQIDEYFIANYGRKIDYCYHNVYKFYSGKFHVDYFPDEFNSPRLMHFVNRKEFRLATSDKNFFPLIAKSAGVKVAYTVFRSVNGVLFDNDYNIISNAEAADLMSGEEELFVKPTVDTLGGSNCVLLHNEDFRDKENDVIDRLISQYKTNFTVQRRVKNCEDVSKIYAESLNTFRITTYFYKGEIYNTNSVLRFGVGGSNLDNASAGGMYVGVYDDGTITDFAISEHEAKTYTSHPDTGLVFKGYKIKDYPKVIQAAKDMHRVLPQLGFIDWDFALDDTNTPLLVEINSTNGGGLQMNQSITGQPAFRERSAEVIRWISETEKVPNSKRNAMRVHM